MKVVIYALVAVDFGFGYGYSAVVILREVTIYRWILLVTRTEKQIEHDTFGIR